MKHEKRGLSKGATEFIFTPVTQLGTKVPAIRYDSGVEQSQLRNS